MPAARQALVAVANDTRPAEFFAYGAPGRDFQAREAKPFPLGPFWRLSVALTARRPAVIGTYLRVRAGREELRRREAAEWEEKDQQVIDLPMEDLQTAEQWLQQQWALPKQERHASDEWLLELQKQIQLKRRKEEETSS